MQEADYELGVASQVKPDAVGVPGQRRFRLLVEAPGGSACLWLEKEQLLQLGVAIQHLISRVSEANLPPKEEPDPPPAALGLPDRSWDFKINTLTLGHDSARNLYMLAAQGLEAESADAPVLRFWMDSGQLNALAEEAFEVCAAGRPLCPLCGAPMNPGETHVCPRGNGHHASVEFK